MLPRILIVDDESSICISLSLALEPEYEVVWETDPIRALERLQTEPIDLVLLDMVIGPYDGLDILMKIKKLAPLAAVIMMTAYGSIRSSVSAMTRGAFTYLTKPLDLEELKIYIRQALEFRSLNENVTYLNDQLEAQNQAEELHRHESRARAGAHDAAEVPKCRCQRPHYRRKRHRQAHRGAHTPQWRRWTALRHGQLRGVR